MSNLLEQGPIMIPMSFILKVLNSSKFILIQIKNLMALEKVEIDGPWIKEKPKESYYLVVKEQWNSTLQTCVINRINNL